MRLTRRKVLTVKCPWCYVPPGEMCKLARGTRNGKPARRLSSFHIDRWDYAERTVKT